MKDESPNESAGTRVIVKKEQPFKTALKLAIIIPIVSALALFTFGLVLGFMGIRPTTVDPNSITDRLPQNSSSNSPSETVSPVKPVDEESAAYKAGVKAGEDFKNFKKDDSASFWAGFNAGQS